MTRRKGPAGASLFLATLLWVILAGSAAAQGPGQTPGALPQDALFRASLLLAQALPFIIALGIFAGLYRVRRESARDSAMAGENAVRRHGRADVGLHWLNAAGILIGLGTAAMLLRWVNRVLDTQLLYVLHYVGAALIVYALSNFMTHALVGGHMGLWPKLREIPEALGELVSYLGIFHEPGVFGIRLPRSIGLPIARLFVTFGIRKPKDVGKYLATEKVLSFPIWAILVGLIFISGLVKTLRYAWPIPTTLVGTATWVHDLTAIAVLIWLVAHIAPTTLVPRNWPLLKSMFTTRVSLDYVKAHHPAWYRQLASDEQTTRSFRPAQGLESVSQPTSD
ncbi:MAG: hypothetical protein M5U01_33650 [Ardenticatenaceae bacterium]|nr:hypothetical protein [Ardenticatenaceae bacterium]HBY96801.1 hypothetical protein [Chloroflexota bacterium]